MKYISRCWHVNFEVGTFSAKGRSNRKPVIIKTIRKNRKNMRNIFKPLIAAGATLALAGSVQAIPTLVITDGNGTSTINTSASGVVTAVLSDGNWQVVVATGISQPPAPGNGTAMAPAMDVSITATYIGNGTAGNNLNIYFGSDGFGPTAGSFLAQLSGHVVSGSGLGVGYTTYDITGSAVPSVGTPVPAGANTLTSTTVSLVGGVYSSQITGGPVNLSTYSLEEQVTLTGAAGGSSYSIDASLTTVPDGGMTLVFLGSALSGLALLKRKLV